MGWGYNTPVNVLENKAQEDSALSRLVNSQEFRSSPRMVQLLEFLVNHPAPDSLKETVIGVGVFGRDATYDPKQDPVVRVEVRRLRGKLLEYYEGSGRQEPLRIDLPKGSYRPYFIQTAPEAAPVVAPVSGSRKALPRAAVVLIATVCIATVCIATAAGWLLWKRPVFPAPSPEPARPLTTPQQNSRAPVFSPSGDEVLYSRDDAGFSHIFRQRLDQAEPQAVTTGEVHDFEPAWFAPDRFAFLRELTAGASYAVMLRDGALGPDREVARVRARSPLTFTSDGSGLVVADREGDREGAAALFLISLSDGRRRRLTQPPAATPGDSSPRLSPDGRQIAFLRASEAAVVDVWLIHTDGSGLRRVTNENQTMEGLDWTADGRSLVTSFSRGTGVRSLWRVDSGTGHAERIAEAGFNPVFPAIARRGHRLAFVVRVADTNLWRTALPAALPPQPITSARLLDTGPQISPDGKLVAYRSTRGGTNEVWIANADGRQLRKLTSMNGPVTGSARWSPDSRYLVFDSRPANNGDIFLIPAGGGEPRPLTNEPSNEVLPSWSRDGSVIYFSSDRSGDWEVYRLPTDRRGVVERLTQRGGFAPFESYDGRWLYYVKRSGSGGIFRRPLRDGPPDAEELVAPLAPSLWGQWALGPRGLYFAEFSQSPGPRAIRRLDLATGRLSTVLPLAALPVQYDSGMSVAPDESWLCWAQLDQAGSDIYLVEGFR